ncbi:MAG TPA: YetF domain-containing protein [Chitinophagaceae bacterium]
MDDIINNLWGDGEQLNALQMSVRAFVMFLIALLFIRLSGKRAFAKKSPFDNVIVIMLGAVLARGVVGASPFFSTVAAAAMMMIIHRILAWSAVENKLANKLLKGEIVPLYKDGKILRRNLEKTTISESDLMQSLRLETQKTTLDDIEMAYLEDNGRISFIVKKQ